MYIFDQQNNPANKKVYNARVYVEQPNGKVSGPYRGSSYPNHPDSQTKHNTVNSGKHLYNNKDGHHRGQSNEQKGLNIVDGNGSRTNTPGKDVNGKSVTMENVNIHSGQPLDNNNQHNRGSAGCPTIHPSDAAGFFSNFDWSSGNGHRGNSEGVVTIYKGESTSSELMESNLQFKQTQEFQEVNNPTAKSDNTGSQLQTRTPNGDAKANPAQIFVLQNIFNGNYTP